MFPFFCHKKIKRKNPASLHLQRYTLKGTHTHKGIHVISGVVLKAPTSASAQKILCFPISLIRTVTLISLKFPLSARSLFHTVTRTSTYTARKPEERMRREKN